MGDHGIVKFSHVNSHKLFSIIHKPREFRKLFPVTLLPLFENGSICVKFVDSAAQNFARTKTAIQNNNSANFVIFRTVDSFLQTKH